MCRKSGILPFPQASGNGVWEGEFEGFGVHGLTLNVCGYFPFLKDVQVPHAAGFPRNTLKNGMVLGSAGRVWSLSGNFGKAGGI